MPTLRRRPLSDAPEALPSEARARLRVWASSHLPWGDQRIGRSWGECRDWHRANGVLRADWEAAFRNWLRREIDFEQRIPTQGGDRNRGSRGRSHTDRLPALGPARRGEPMPLGDALADVIPLQGGRGLTGAGEKS